MKVKDAVKYLIIFILIIQLIVYRETVIAVFDRILLYAEGFNGADYAVIEDRSRQIERALRAKDAAALRALFSSYAARKSRTLNSQIDALLALDNWDITSRRGKLVEIVENKSPGAQEKYFVAKYTYQTYTGKYVVFFIDQTECADDVTKIGLYFLQCEYASNKNKNFIANKSQTGVSVGTSR